MCIRDSPWGRPFMNLIFLEVSRPCLVVATTLVFQLAHNLRITSPSQTEACVRQSLRITTHDRRSRRLCARQSMPYLNSVCLSGSSALLLYRLASYPSYRNTLISLLFAGLPSDHNDQTIIHNPSDHNYCIVLY